MTVFATLLAASAIAALVPDWATTLKAQGYSSVDLQLDVQPSVSVLSAGTSADLFVTVANAGPDRAASARTITLLDGDASAIGTSGCAEDPLGFPDCHLSAPLPPGGAADYLMTFSLSPLARGDLNVVVAATSDDVEAVPGQELSLLQLPIEAHVDLQASVTCDRPYFPASHPVSCEAILRNAGPAAALYPYLAVSVAGATVSNLDCIAPRPELCPFALPGGWYPSMLMPDETVTLSFALSLDPGWPVDAVYIDSAAYASSEFEDVPWDNDSAVEIPVPLFRDGFEEGW